MSAQRKSERYVSLDEYFEILLSGDVKYEWFNGMMWPVGNPDNLPQMMAGAQRPHNSLKHNIERSLGNQLDERPCDVFSGDQQVKVEESDLFFFPDIVVACEGAKYRKERGIDTLLNPIVLVEILSPTTKSFDVGDKWAHYQLIPSLRDYLVIHSDLMRVLHFNRHGETGWHQEVYVRAEDEIQLSGVPARLKLSEIYRRVEFDFDANSKLPRLV